MQQFASDHQLRLQCISLLGETFLPSEEIRTHASKFEISKRLNLHIEKTFTQYDTLGTNIYMIIKY